jgi:hypothetical protein
VSTEVLVPELVPPAEEVLPALEVSPPQDAKSAMDKRAIEAKAFFIVFIINTSFWGYDYTEKTWFFGRDYSNIIL